MIWVSYQFRGKTNRRWCHFKKKNRYEIFFCSFSDEETLSAIMRRKINAPNRLLLTDECYGSLVLGFPDLESSENEVFCWHRPKYAREYGWSGLFGKSIFVKENFQVFSLPLPPLFEFQVFRKREKIFKISFCFQIVTPVNKILAPEEVQKETGGSSCLGFLEVVDLKRSKIQYLPVPE